MFHAFIWLSEKKLNKTEKIIHSIYDIFKVSSYNQFILATFK